MATGAVFWLIAVGYTSRAVLLITGLLGLARYRKLRGLRYLVWLVWFGLAVELAAQLLHDVKGNNLVMVPLDASGEIWLLSLLYVWALESPWFTRLRLWVASGFVVYAGLSSVMAPEFVRFKTGVLVVESLLLLLLAGLYYRKVLNELRVLQLDRDPMFWVSTGLILYALGKLLISLFGNYVLEHYSQQLSLTVWTIHGLLTIVLYLCYLRALWLRPQK